MQFLKKIRPHLSLWRTYRRNKADFLLMRNHMYMDLCTIRNKAEAALNTIQDLLDEAVTSENTFLNTYFPTKR